MSRHHPLYLKVRSFLLAAVWAISLVPVGAQARQTVFRPNLPAATSGGTVIVVNDPADPGDPGCSDTSCSLRAAIVAANAGSTSGVQTIDFSLTYPVTITLNSPLPAITGTVVINGPGYMNLTVSGDSQHRVLEVGSGASLDLSGIAIRQGNDAIRGGGILNDQGTLSLSDSLIADNMVGAGEGGGLHNAGGAVSIATTTFADNNAFHNGGITNSGTMTVTNSLFSGNSSRLGGAISNSGALTITGSTFTQNLAPQISGGAIQNGGTLVLANSTFFDNGSTTGADIHNANGTANVTNSTFYSSTLPSLDSIVSFGISATVTLSNTLLAAGAGIDSCSAQGGGTLNAGADNLAIDGTCASATVVTSDQLVLGPLQDNGGSTPTLALLPGSVAVDAGDDAVCAALVGAPGYGAGGKDQRGLARPLGEHCDVGAVEQLPVRLYIPLTLQALP